MGSRRSKRCGRTVGGDLRRRIWLLAFLCWSGGYFLSAARAGEAPDDGLLEFLGSVDSEDKDWHDYLARTDIDRIARRAGDAPARAKPADPPTRPATDAPSGVSRPATPPATASPVTPP